MLTCCCRPGLALCTLSSPATSLSAPRVVAREIAAALNGMTAHLAVGATMLPTFSLDHNARHRLDHGVNDSGGHGLALLGCLGQQLQLLHAAAVACGRPSSLLMLGACLLLRQW